MTPLALELGVGPRTLDALKPLQRTDRSSFEAPRGASDADRRRISDLEAPRRHPGVPRRRTLPCSDLPRRGARALQPLPRPCPERAGGFSHSFTVPRGSGSFGEPPRRRQSRSIAKSPGVLPREVPLLPLAHRCRPGCGLVPRAGDALVDGGRRRPCVLGGDCRGDLPAAGGGRPGAPRRVPTGWRSAGPSAFRQSRGVRLAAFTPAKLRPHTFRRREGERGP